MRQQCVDLSPIDWFGKDLTFIKNLHSSVKRLFLHSIARVRYTLICHHGRILQQSEVTTNPNFEAWVVILKHHMVCTDPASLWTSGTWTGTSGTARTSSSRAPSLPQVRAPVHKGDVIHRADKLVPKVVRFAVG
jgi:hypothetical protein